MSVTDSIHTETYYTYEIYMSCVKAEMTQTAPYTPMPISSKMHSMPK